MPDCTCYWVDPKYWTTHYGAVDPATTMEPNPDRLVHFPENDPEGLALVQAIHDRKAANG
ncbi:hypothetical protein HYQ00_gp75 [Arthrobacter phage TripleJ]|uniref:Uncharacterized protein n=1 Tax=Arthrobacter phage TripleJ TaxID=2599838 RepID=A0A5J6TIR3_9CAUD|nr:hypothetical protein HYQ00_gp75 [Arthrobacter phage TripleJ]QFG09619.1 hypothetical protein PBI_TRIPLEJ_75 [Arthrobacter phage TripleJ]